MRNPLTLIAIAGFAALLLAGCGGNVAIRVDHVPPATPTGTLASAPATAIRVTEFGDQRSGATPHLIGQRGDMDQVRALRPVSEIVTEAIRAELKAAGHKLVEGDEQVRISGAINRFEVKTPAATLHWDVVAEVALAVEVRPAAGTGPVVTSTYEATATERTYISPSDKLLKETLERALAEAMKLMRNDAALARVLGQRT
jgi:uncharacterized lipoprotein YajG